MVSEEGQVKPHPQVLGGCALLDAGEAERKTELDPGASAPGDRLLCTKYIFCFPANSPRDARATISHLVGFLVTIILEAPPVTLTTCL